MNSPCRSDNLVSSQRLLCLHRGLLGIEAMPEIIAYCGIICSDCEAYIATQANDVEGLARVADRWNREYSLECTVDDMWCDGCLGEGRRIATYCAGCEIRACAIARGHINCAYCKEYYCDKLRAESEGKVVLDRIREGLDL